MSGVLYRSVVQRGGMFERQYRELATKMPGPTERLRRQIRRFCFGQTDRSESLLRAHGNLERHLIPAANAVSDGDVALTVADVDLSEGTAELLRIRILGRQRIVDVIDSELREAERDYGL